MTTPTAPAHDDHGGGFHQGNIRFWVFVAAGASFIFAGAILAIPLLYAKTGLIPFYLLQKISMYWAHVCLIYIFLQVIPLFFRAVTEAEAELDGMTSWLPIVALIGLFGAVQMMALTTTAEVWSMVQLSIMTSVLDIALVFVGRKLAAPAHH